jgi:hypothetical protein
MPNATLFRRLARCVISQPDKKELARNLIRASSVELVFYANLIAVVMMITMVVDPVPVPVVRGPPGIAIVPIRPVISIRIIAVAIRVIAIVIAVPITWIPKPHSYAPNSH